MSDKVRSLDGLQLKAYDWTHPDSKLVMAVLHGYGEHAGRYKRAAEALGRRGVGVFAVDLRGHGQSEGPRGHVQRFEDYYADAAALLEEARARAAGRPVVLFGHSMGGLLALDYVMACAPAGLSGLALSSPFLGLALKVNALKLGLGRAMSHLAPGFSMPSGLKGVDVTRDPDEAEKYDRDPLNNDNATARWFTESQKAIERVQARAASIRLPLWLMYGGSDRVADADATDRFASGLSVDGVVERLTGYYHELLNEPQEARELVLSRLGDWLLSREAVVR